MGTMVLIADDDRDNLNMMRLIAKTIGASVGLVSSGEEALLELKSGRYGKLITDLFMPGMDGLTLARLAREEYPGLEVVMMTGSIVAGLDEKAARAGISRVVAKPLGSDLLCELF